MQIEFLSDTIFFVAVNESDSFDTSISLCYISKSELNTSFKKEEAPASHLVDAFWLLAGNTKTSNYFVSVSVGVVACTFFIAK